MYKGQHTAKSSARKAKVGKTAAVAVAVILAVVLAVGGTVAYLTTHTQELTNIFSPSTVMAKVEGGDDNGVYTIRNDGDVEAYLRVAIVANWLDNSLVDDLLGDSTIHWKQPEFTVTASDNWDLGDDGFYYYKNPVAAQTDIADKLTVTLNNGESAPTGYKFSVQVIAEAIQSEPAEAVTEAWGVTVSGTTISK